MRKTKYDNARCVLSQYFIQINIVLRRISMRYECDTRCALATRAPLTLFARVSSLLFEM